MTNGDRRTIIIARLRAKPLAAGQLLCALALAALILKQARGDTAGEVVRHILFGDVVMTALMMAGGTAPMVMGSSTGVHICRNSR